MMRRLRMAARCRRRLGLCRPGVQRHNHAILMSSGEGLRRIWIANGSRVRTVTAGGRLLGA
jgi:hypothetical protein